MLFVLVELETIVVRSYIYLISLFQINNLQQLFLVFLKRTLREKKGT